jgi:hypothetical protein
MCMTMTRVATVPSSDGERTYVISVQESGEYACSCMGWTRHVPRKECRHIRDYRYSRPAAVTTQQTVGALPEGAGYVRNESGGMSYYAYPGERAYAARGYDKKSADRARRAAERAAPEPVRAAASLADLAATLTPRRARNEEIISRLHAAAGGFCSFVAWAVANGPVRFASRWEALEID